MGIQTQKGFTIIELIVAMGSGAIVVSALVYFFSGSLTSYRTQLSHVAATADARIQMQRIVDTLRNAQDNGEIAAWLGEASANSITVWTDTNGDGTLEQISYTKDGTGKQLIRTADGVQGTIIQNLDPSQDLFVYYHANGDEIVDPDVPDADTIKSIGITLAIVPNNPQTSDPQVVATRITPRQILQGDIAQVQGPVDDREIIIEVPAGDGPDPAKNTATVRVQNPSSGAGISQSIIPFTELNDGRLRVYENDMYAHLNYKQDNSDGKPNWYVWIIMNIPAELNILPIPIRYPIPPNVNDNRKYYNFHDSKCMGTAWVTAQAECKLGGSFFGDNFIYMFLGNEPFQPILTYSADGYKDYVRDIIVAPPTLTKFTSSTANGLYGPGNAITITATYDELVKAGSTLKVLLNTGKEVTLSTTVSTGLQLSGTYTVGAIASGENSDDLAIEAITSESVKSVATPLRTRTNSIVPVDNNLSDNADIIVNTQYWASDLLGQYVNASDSSNVIYTQGGVNNGQATNVNNLGLASPYAVAQDATGNRLFVADRANHRVLVYNLNDGNRVPDAVLGQANFDSNTAATTQSGMKNPSGLAYDPNPINPRLFVADTGNHRVLVFNAASFTNGQIADVVLGQASFTANSIAYHPWGMKSPNAVAYDTVSNRLFVADTGNHRVLVFTNANTLAISNESSDFVLGQPNYGSNTAATTQSRMRTPSGLLYDASGSRLFVADTFNNRVLVFNTETITNGENAESELGRMIGETEFTSRDVISPPTPWSMNEPAGLAYDSSTKKLFVSVSAENRILIFDVAAIANGESAEGLTRIIGQPDFTKTAPKLTIYGLRSPRGIAYYNGKLYVTDMLHNRVLVFSYPNP